jgi:tripartite-type tricarboxylate transporter receptor subunit TctC
LRPKGTPPEIIERLNREINAGLENLSVKRPLAGVAATPVLFTPREFGAHMAAEIEKWGRVVRFARIKPA